MDMLEIGFWVCAVVVGYTYLGYPLLLALAGRWLGRPHQPGPASATFSIVLPIHNEEHNLLRRLEELTRQVDESGQEGEILVVSDASNDHSAMVARAFAD